MGSHLAAKERIQLPGGGPDRVNVLDEDLIWGISDASGIAISDMSKPSGNKPTNGAGISI